MVSISAQIGKSSIMGRAGISTASQRDLDAFARGSRRLRTGASTAGWTLFFSFTDRDRSLSMQRYYVRVGALGEIHLAEGDSSLAPGQRVIVRTARGVELGWIASPIRRLAVDRAGNTQNETAHVLRPTTAQDELLLKRLERHKRRAVEACRTALAASGSNAILLDVDQIFDGGTLVMHFLGDPDEQAEAVTARVAAQYEAVVRSRHFAKLLQDGCGPGCGTAEAGGCGGGGGCSQCQLAVSCASRSE